MKTIIRQLVSILIMGSSMAAYADGFNCLSQSGDLKIKIYHHVKSEGAVDSPARMILSNPSNNGGAKTIAVFNDAGGALGIAAESVILSSTTYVGLFDQSEIKTSTVSDAMVLGEKIANLQTIQITVDFRSGDSLVNGSVVEGLITLERKTGELIREEALCSRYSKAE
jgi:hypothetical protein